MIWMILSIAFAVLGGVVLALYLREIRHAARLDRQLLRSARINAQLHAVNLAERRKNNIDRNRLQQFIDRAKYRGGIREVKSA